MQNVTIDNIIKSLVDDLSNPNLAGEYQIVFVSSSPFSDATTYDLHVRISKEGTPSFALPEGFNTPEELSTRLESFLMKNHRTFKDALLLLNKMLPQEVEKTWAWQIESNGHLTPLDLRTEANTYDVDPSALDKFLAGWTINHPSEILLSVYEGLKLLELSGAYAHEHDLEKFDIHFILDGVRNSFYARKDKESNTFALDQNYYMELFTAFKNGSYLVEKTARVLIKFPNKKSYQWDNIDGVLVGVENKERSAGWDIEFNESDAEELMEFLSRTEDELDETVNPQERNAEVTESQANLLSYIIPDDHKDDPQFICYFFLPDKRIISTVLLQDKGRQIVELPHVLEKISEFDEPVQVVVQTLSSSEQKDDAPFEYYGFVGSQKYWSVLSSAQVKALTEQLNHSVK